MVLGDAPEEMNPVHGDEPHLIRVATIIRCDSPRRHRVMEPPRGTAGLSFGRYRIDARAETLSNPPSRGQQFRGISGSLTFSDC
jgi:hypothetical protein